jgi:hypothetical protein
MMLVDAPTMPTLAKRLESTLTGGSGASWLWAPLGAMIAALERNAASRAGDTSDLERLGREVWVNPVSVDAAIAEGQRQFPQGSLRRADGCGRVAI